LSRTAADTCGTVESNQKSEAIPATSACYASPMSAPLTVGGTSPTTDHGISPEPATPGCLTTSESTPL
jgi:hypothetical protein